MKKITTQNQIKMERYSNEELLEVLPVGLKETRELTTKQKIVLGQLYIYNGLNNKDGEGFFYRSNLDLATDCDIQEKTVISATRKLAFLELINTKRGSRTSGASLYKVNEDKMKEYCNTNTVKYSENYSKQIVEMADKIKELENTVKMLVDRITVIKTANYSIDKDIDIEKEKDINNNIINNNTINNILEVTERIEELEEGESEEKPTVSQPVITESPSSPIEELSQASPVTNSTQIEDTHTSTEDESIPVEQQTIPSEEDQYQQWLQVQTPYLKELENVKTLRQFEIIKDILIQIGGEYLDNHEYISQTVIERMNKTVGSALRTKRNDLPPNEMELSDYIKQHNNGSL